MDNTGIIKPVAGIGEHNREQETEAVRQMNTSHETFHGFNINNAQAVGVEQLGIREDLAANMNRRIPGRGHFEQIVDEDVTQTLRNTVVTREIDLRRQQMPWWRRKLAEAAGSFWNVLSVLALNNKNISAVGRQQERSYGINRFFQAPQTTEQKRLHVAQQVWNGLTPGNRAAVSGNLILRGVPLPPAGPVNPQIQQMANADPQQLMEMRVALSTPAAPIFPPVDINNHPLFPRTRPRGFDIRTQPFGADMPWIDRLIELRNIEGNSRKKRLSSTVYDYRRLQNWYDGVQIGSPAIFHQIEEILEENGLFSIKDNPEALALLSHFEERWRRLGPVQIAAELTAIRNQLPTVPEQRQEGHEPSENLRNQEKIKELYKSLNDNYKVLKDSYPEAPGIGVDIFNLRSEDSALATGGVTAKDRRAELGRNLTTRGNELVTLRKKINKAETIYRDSASELLSILGASTGGIAAGSVTAAFNAFNVQNFQSSTEADIFGHTTTNVPPALPTWTAPLGAGLPAVAFRDHVMRATPDGFSQRQMEQMSREINETYLPKFQPRKRLPPAELLIMLTTQDVTRAGITNPGMAYAIAYEKSNLNIAHANPKNVQFRRSINLQLAHRLGEEVVGSRPIARIVKWLKAKKSGSEIFEIDEIIKYICGMDPELKIFIDIRPEITQAELRDLLDRNGCKDPKVLLKFRGMLREVSNSFETLDTEGKVKMYDALAVKLEAIHDVFEETEEQMYSEELYAKIPGMHHKLDEILAEVTKNRLARKGDDEIMKGLSEHSAEWKQFFSRKTLKEKTMDKIIVARLRMKKEKMVSKRRKEFLENEGLATAYDVLKYGLAAKEALDVVGAVAGWTGHKLKGGAETVVETGAKAGRGIWNNVLYPIGKYGIYEPLKFAGWTVPKFVVYDAPKAIFTAPFKLVKKIFGGGGKAAGGHGAAAHAPAH